MFWNSWLQRMRVKRHESLAWHFELRLPPSSMRRLEGLCEAERTPPVLIHVLQGCEDRFQDRHNVLRLPRRALIH